MNRQELENTATQLLFGTRGFIIPSSDLNDTDYKNKIVSGIKIVLNFQQTALNNMPNKKAKKYTEYLRKIEKLNSILKELA